MGDGIKKDTVAIGVLCIKIKHAVGLKAQDRSGSSDRTSISFVHVVGLDSLSFLDSLRCIGIHQARKTALLQSYHSAGSESRFQRDGCEFPTTLYLSCRICTYLCRVVRPRNPRRNQRQRRSLPPTLGQRQRQRRRPSRTRHSPPKRPHRQTEPAHRPRRPPIGL